MTERTTPPRPLDPRKEQILRAIVEAYVREGEPVGSRTVAGAGDLGVSSATIRNEMGTLEREGYIGHPHTSAGRVPTDKGYRYYVDVLAPNVRPEPATRREIERFLAGTLTALDELLERASQLLVDLTDYTSLASAPSLAEARLTQVEIVALGGTRSMVVLVGEGAWHEERIVELPFEPDAEAIRRAVQFANAVVAGKTLSEAAAALNVPDRPQDVGEIVDALVQAVRAVGRQASRVITGGASRLVVWEPPPTAERVLKILEDGAVEPLLPEPVPEGVTVRIGREFVLEDLHDLSLIAAGYRFGRRGGTLGVLGPTRMDYPTVISTVAEVAASLSKVLRGFGS